VLVVTDDQLCALKFFNGTSEELLGKDLRKIDDETTFNPMTLPCFCNTNEERLHELIEETAEKKRNNS